MLSDEVRHSVSALCRTVSQCTNLRVRQMSQEIPPSGVILNERQERVIQAFRDHSGAYNHRPPSSRFLPAGKLGIGVGKVTRQSLIDMQVLEYVSGKGWRLTSLGWELAEHK